MSKKRFIVYSKFPLDETLCRAETCQLILYVVCTTFRREFWLNFLYFSGYSNYIFIFSDDITACRYYVSVFISIFYTLVNFY